MWVSSPDGALDYTIHALKKYIVQLYSIIIDKIFVYYECLSVNYVEEERCELFVQKQKRFAL